MDKETCLKNIIYWQNELIKYYKRGIISRVYYNLFTDMSGKNIKSKIEFYSIRLEFLGGVQNEENFLEAYE